MITQYALLDSTQQIVVEIDSIDSDVYATWVAAGNPKATFFRIVNMIAQPTINPLTQVVTQNGWTITDVDVEPVWVTTALTTAQITQATGVTNYQAALALNIVAASTNAITNWASLSAAQKDTILLDMVKVMRGILQVQFGVNN